MKRTLAVLTAFVSLSAAAQDLSKLGAVNVRNGKMVVLGDYRDSPGVVVIQTSNDCPFDVYYTGRIASLIAAYNSRLPIILVNSSPELEESAEAMKTKIEEWKLTVPYLADKDQLFLKDLRCQKSPEAFVLKRTGDGFTVFYRGAIDDNAQVPGDVHAMYLRDAMDALLAGRAPAKPEVRAVGCIIRKR